MRIRGYGPDGNGNLNDPCGDLQYGNTVDVSVNIIDSILSVDDFQIRNSDLRIVTALNNQYEIILSSSLTDDISFNLFTMLGQQLVYDVLSKDSSGNYIYKLDMSYASSGTYIVKIGRGKSYKTAKLIVR